MKYSFLIIGLIIVNISFAQQKASFFSESLYSKKLESSFNTNQNKNILLEKPEVVSSFNTVTIFRNSEGKFPFTDLKSTLNLNDISKKNNPTNLLETTSTKKVGDILILLDALVIKVLMANDIDVFMTNNSRNFGDKNVLYYKETYDEVNELILTKKISDKSSIQIGNDIRSHIHKLYKTSIDKTLINSLNILAFNF
ncbi:hypothetical protein [Polaribacter tangerinus]|uniref:hypothetical protein n=1 Tax=Polaribacter tangerinus TaxID=1920034 RepID=UPI00117CEE2E|nr:hypothetical protein [Polaribacter tangerinus]